MTPQRSINKPPSEYHFVPFVVPNMRRSHHDATAKDQSTLSSQSSDSWKSRASDASTIEKTPSGDERPMSSLQLRCPPTCEVQAVRRIPSCDMLLNLLTVRKSFSGETKAVRQKIMRAASFNTIHRDENSNAPSVRQRLRTDITSARAFDKIINHVLVNDSKITVLSFRGRQVDDLDAMKLAIALRGNTHVASIDLGDCNLTSEGAKSLFDSLRKNGAVRKLWLDGNRIGKKGAGAAAVALRNRKNALQTLDLSSNRIGSEGAGYIAKALSSGDVLDLTVLNLGNNGIGGKGAEEITNALYAFTKLTKLRLDRNEIGSGHAKMLAVALRHNGTIRCIDLIGAAYER